MSAQLSGQPDIPPQLAAALSYYDKGWSVVPAHKIIKLTNAIACSCIQGSACTSKGKHPAIAWTRYQTERASREQIIEWFAGKYRTYSVGLITGKVSGFFVVDIDEAPGKPGAETIHDVQMVHGDLPLTVQARTGGGGRHILLKHPGTRYITTAKNVLGPGVDVRGDGGFIVAAPSLHESGRYYLWNEHAHPNTTPIADAPEWLLDFVWTDAAPASGSHEPSTGHGEIIRNEWGRIIDGRESYMIRVICGVIASYCKEHHALPTADHVFEQAWDTYESHVAARGASLEADGRGPTLMRQRIDHMLRRAASGKWKVVEQTAEAQDAKPKRPAILHLEEVLKLPPPDWLIDGLIPQHGLTVVYGAPKSGKTFIILSASLHIAANKEWFGKKVVGGCVVYIAGEGLGGLGLRLKAMMARYKLNSNIPFYVIPRALNFTNPNTADNLVKLVRDTVCDEPVAAVIMDTLARAMPGADENSAQEVGLVIAACDKVRDELDCAVIPLHHQGKDEARGLRGTSAIHGAVDALFHVKTVGKSLFLRNDDQKDAERAPEMIFSMEEIAVGIGRTSLVPVLPKDIWDENEAGTGGTFRPQGQTVTSGHPRLCLDCLIDLLATEAGQFVPPAHNVPAGMRGVTVDVLRSAFYEKLPAHESEAKKKAFERALNRLRELRLIGIKAPWIWMV